MSTFSRYIARLYLINILTLLIVLFSFVVTVDVIINLGRFSRAADKMTQAAGNPGDSPVHHAVLTAVLVIDLWGPRLLQLFTYLVGVVLIAGVGFTASQLVRHRELVAMLAGGVSLHRVARPFLGVGALMVGAQGAVQELFIPPVAHLLTRDPGESGKREVAAFQVKLAPDDEGRLWYAARFDDSTPSGATLEDVHVWERDAASRLTRVISATRATWNGTGWSLEQGLARPPALAQGGAPTAPVPVGSIATNLDPTRLKVRYLQGFGQSLSWREISSMIAGGGLDQQSSDRLDRVRWGRVAGLLSNFVALWAVLPLFLLKEPRPLLGAALRASPVALAAFAASAIATSAPVPGLPVWIGVFIPSAVLLSVAVALNTALET